MKKFILMFCLMVLGTLSVSAQETALDQKESILAQCTCQDKDKAPEQSPTEDQVETLLVGCPCKNKDKKPT